MNDMTKYITLILLISSWGGIASFMHNYSKRRKKFIVWGLIKKLMIATFAGAMVGFICIENNYSAPMTLLYCGLAGNMGELVLRFLNSKYFPPR